MPFPPAIWRAGALGQAITPVVVTLEPWGGRISPRGARGQGAYPDVGHVGGPGRSVRGSSHRPHASTGLPPVGRQAEPAAGAFYAVR